MYPRGMDTEVFSFNALKEAHFEATKQVDREHVTSFIYQQPQRYRLCNVPYVSDESHHRWTVDTPEDLELITLIYEALYYQNPDFSLRGILDLLKDNPDWFSINAHIEQKHYG
jgi:spore coat polysaccharide biosynthesis protein SpsF